MSGILKSSFAPVRCPRQLGVRIGLFPRVRQFGVRVIPFSPQAQSYIFVLHEFLNLCTPSTQSLSPIVSESHVMLNQSQFDVFPFSSTEKV